MRNYRSDFSRGDRPALDAVAQTDLLLDALAARTEAGVEDFECLEDEALVELLGEWRDDLRWPPASALVSQDEAEAALRHGILERRGGRRGLAAVGSVAATLLALSGFGAVIADAKPGDLLYGLHAMMFNEPRVSDDQIALSAKADLAKAEQMIAEGQWDQAQTQLAEVSSTLRGVNDGSRRQGLLAELDQLNTKVEQRAPKASRPASPPANSPTPIPTTTPQPTTTAPVPSSTPTATVPATTAPTTTVPTTTVPTTTVPAPVTSTPPSPTDNPTPSSKTRHRHRHSTTPSEIPDPPTTP